MGVSLEVPEEPKGGGSSIWAHPASKQAIDRPMHPFIVLSID
jgi:hypothetical protein